MRSAPRGVLSVLAVLGLVAAGCGDDSSRGASSPAAPKVTGALTVLAAASLTDAFEELGAAFEAAHPGAKVTFGFAASSALATQVNQGAPADVFASADAATMDKVTAAGAVGRASPPQTFAKNTLQIIVGKGNPKGITGLADLARPGVVYVTAAKGVPIGTYAQQVLDNAKVRVTPKSLEADVKAIVTKVTLGEADAGIVYATDVKGAGDKAQGVVIPDDLSVIVSYPIAVLKGARNAAAADAFVAYVTSSAGQAVLAEHGFASS